MKTVLNILWLLLGGGLPIGVGWIQFGILACMTIVGIPFGLACFRLAALVFWPFGRELRTAPLKEGKNGGFMITAGNAIWLISIGIWLALAHLSAAIPLFVSIIGIPFAFAHLKLAAAALAPFGKRIQAV